MKKLIPVALLLLFVVPSVAFGAINPIYKECSQRNYTIWGDHCIFPDGTNCTLDKFNAGTCGAEFLTQNYCVTEGQNVWDNDKCCPGLAPYYPIGVSGQKTCEKIGGPILLPFLLAILIILSIALLVYFWIKKHK